jgi:acetylornithine deacetylase/succinyl-diaminopimelate desuccinylase-like protein
MEELFMETIDLALNNIEANYMDYISDLQRLVRQPSVSAKGEGIAECASLVRETLERRGIKARILKLDKANPLVYGELAVRGASKTVLFYNHYDVQPAEPFDLWKVPPFSGELIENKVYGRGAADDKGEIMSRIAVVDSFMKTGKDPPCSFKFVIEGEEEIGSVNLHRYAESYKDLFKADAGIWEFGGVDTKQRPLLRLGMKGMLYVEITLRGANRDLHSSLAAIVPSPVWRMMRLLNSLKAEDDRITIPGWEDKVVPLKDWERKILEDYPYDEQGALESYGLKQFINGLTGLPLKEKLFTKPTCNICGIYSGYQGPGSKTVLPNEIRAKLDFRLVPEQDPDELAALLRTHLQRLGYGDAELICMEGEPAARVSPDEPIARSARSAAKRFYGMPALIELSSPATGPLYVFTKNLGIPCAAIGTGHPDDMQHSPNESKRLDTFVKGSKWVAQTVYYFASGSYDG